MNRAMQRGMIALVGVVFIIGGVTVVSVASWIMHITGTNNHATGGSPAAVLTKYVMPLFLLWVGLTFISTAHKVPRRRLLPADTAAPPTKPACAHTRRERVTMHVTGEDIGWFCKDCDHSDTRDPDPFYTEPDAAEQKVTLRAWLSVAADPRARAAAMEARSRR